jgi:hypothetical protein
MNSIGPEVHLRDGVGEDGAASRRMADRWLPQHDMVTGVLLFEIAGRGFFVPDGGRGRFLASRQNAFQENRAAGQSEPQDYAFKPGVPQHEREWSGNPEAQAVEAIEKAPEKAPAGQTAQPGKNTAGTVFSPKQVSDPPNGQDRECG